MVKVNKTLKETVVGFVPHNKTFTSDLEHVLSVISLSKNQPFHSIFIAVPSTFKEIVGKELNSKVNIVCIQDNKKECIFEIK